MKVNIHPEYQQIKVHCGCGAEHVLYSTRKSMQIEICSQCHPFYAGNQKIVDATGRVDRFKRKYKLK